MPHDCDDGDDDDDDDIDVVTVANVLESVRAIKNNSKAKYHVMTGSGHLRQVLYENGLLGGHGAGPIGGALNTSCFELSTHLLQALYGLLDVLFRVTVHAATPSGARPRYSSIGDLLQRR